MSTESGEGPGTGTVSRAVHLMAMLADAPGPVTVKQVGDFLKVPSSTAHRLLNLLVAEGMAEATGGGMYGLGSRFYRIAARVSQGMSPAALAKPIVEALAAKYNETVLLGLHSAADRAMTFALRADGSQKLTYQIELHRPLSLYWGASGKAILAFLPEEQIELVLRSEGKSPATGEAPPSARVGMAELREVRERGWALSEGQKLPGARGIAAPIFGATGVVGSLCVTSPRERMPHANIDAIAKDLMDKASEISHLLGGQR